MNEENFSEDTIPSAPTEPKASILFALRFLEQVLRKKGIDVSNNNYNSDSD